MTSSRRFIERWVLSIWVGLAVFVLPFASRAQQPVVRPTPLPALGRSVAGNDDSTAIVQNPANLRFLPATELRWSGVFLDESAEVLQQGHALMAGFSSQGMPLGLGVRFDIIDPPAVAALTSLGRSVGYQYLTLAGAMGSDNASLGFSWQRSYSDTTLLHGFGSWTAALSSRPVDFLGVSLIARAFNEPKSDAGWPLYRSYVIATALRPLGSRRIELGLEGEYIDEAGGWWIPRATLGVDVPYFGRLRGELSVSDPAEEVQESRAWTAGVSLALWGNAMGGSIELGGGVAFGNGLGVTAGNRALSNLNGDIAFRFFREPTGAEAADYALEIPIEQTPDARQHVALLRKLWTLADDEPAVRAVVLELRASPGETFAHVEELRDAIGRLRQRGKKVLCHFDNGGAKTLYLCSAADRTLMTRSGNLSVAGLRMRYLHIKRLLDKLGVKADFIRIGEHKSAPEGYTRSESSDITRADRTELLQQLELGFTGGVAHGRGLSAETLRKTLAGGPFTAPDSVRAHLVDGIAYSDELEGEVQRLTGLSLPLLEDHRAPVAPKYFGPQRKIALVYIEDGDLVDGRSKTYPFIGMSVVGSYTISDVLDQVASDPTIGAVVLRVESPGGSSSAADAMWRAVERANTVKPVVVSMGGVAASGGYYLAAPARRIFANSTTVTGSIGIYYGKADVTELMRRVGVDVEVYKTSPAADAEAVYRPFTEEERKRLTQTLRQHYDLFVERVASGRGLQKSEVEKVAQGKVYSGRQAVARGLVDELGGLRQAFAYARQLANLGPDAPVVELPKPDQSLLGRLLGVEGIHERSESAVPKPLADVAKALAPFAVHRGDQPMMRLEFAPVVE